MLAAAVGTGLAGCGQPHEPARVRSHLATATRDAYLTYLAQEQAATDRALDGIATAGPAPVDNGEQVTEEVRSESPSCARPRRCRPGSRGDARTAAIGSSVVAAGNIVGAVANSAQALSALDGNPRIDVAFDQAQSCQQLRTVQLPGR